jgi:hypothetical protein
MNLQAVEAFLADNRYVMNIVLINHLTEDITQANIPRANLQFVLYTYN